MHFRIDVESLKHIKAIELQSFELDVALLDH